MLGVGQWIGLALLAPPALSDFRSRRVPDHLWAPPLLLGLILTTGVALLFPSVAVWGRAIIAIVVIGGGGLALGRAGLIGGADAKAAAVIALLYPVAPASTAGLSLPLFAPPGGVLALAIILNVAVLGPLYFVVQQALGGDGAVPYLVPLWLSTALALTVGPVVALAPGF